MDCVFCQIISGDIPSFKVYEDTEVYAFLDIRPTTEGHTLIVPKKHTDSLLTIDDQDLAAVTRATRNLAQKYTRALNADGFTLWNNCGEAGEQIVFHFHMHLLPRYTDDGLHLAAPANEQIDIEAVHKRILSA